MFHALAEISTFMLAAGDLPGFDKGLDTWVKDQAGVFVVMIVVILAAVFLVRQSWGKLVGTIFIGGIVFFVIGKPETTLKTIGNIVEKFLGS